LIDIAIDVFITPFLLDLTFVFVFVLVHCKYTSFEEPTIRKNIPNLPGVKAKTKSMGLLLHTSP
jgi:hypothetical protein